MCLHLAPIKAQPRLLSVGEHLPQSDPEHPGIRRMGESTRLQRLRSTPGARRGRRQRFETENRERLRYEVRLQNFIMCDQAAVLTTGKGFCGPPPWCIGRCFLAAPSSDQSLRSSPCRWWTAEHCEPPGPCGGSASAPDRPYHTPPTHQQRQHYLITPPVYYISEANIVLFSVQEGFHFHFLLCVWSVWC